MLSSFFLFSTMFVLFFFYKCILCVHCDMTNCRVSGSVLSDSSWVLYNLYFLKGTPKGSLLVLHQVGKVRWMLEPV